MAFGPLQRPTPQHSFEFLSVFFLFKPSGVLHSFSQIPYPSRWCLCQPHLSIYYFSNFVLRLLPYFLSLSSSSPLVFHSINGNWAAKKWMNGLHGNWVDTAAGHGGELASIADSYWILPSTHLQATVALAQPNVILDVWPTKDAKSVGDIEMEKKQNIIRVIMACNVNSDVNLTKGIWESSEEHRGL